jgi:exodeoxyribonuclease VII large subunit
MNRTSDLLALPPASAAPVVPVSLLVGTARLVLERNLPLMWVAGEISNCTRAASGHYYFSLKDEGAQVRCVLFRQKAQLQGTTLRDGLQVEVRATATIYEARGEFQLNVEVVRLAGVGRLYAAFDRLKTQLEARGWFAAERKRPLPAHARRVGVITSPAGAALHDVLTTLARRFPSIPVVVYPTPVQGAGAAESIAAAIRLANHRAECDVLVVCRGGGSIEDLWAFNEEAVARAVFESAIPVVSGVGHETDFTICDFVADLRAPTPTAAATLAVPDCVELRARSASLGMRLRRALERQLERAMQRADEAGRRLRHPAERLHDRRLALSGLAARIASAGGRRLERDGERVERAGERLARVFASPLRPVPAHGARAARFAAAGRTLIDGVSRRLQHAAQALALLDPKAVLERGYGFVTDEAGRVVSSAAALRPGQAVRIGFAHDEADALITATRSASPAVDATPDLAVPAVGATPDVVPTVDAAPAGDAAPGADS